MLRTALALTLMLLFVAPATAIEFDPYATVDQITDDAEPPMPDPMPLPEPRPVPESPSADAKVVVDADSSGSAAATVDAPEGLRLHASSEGLARSGEAAVHVSLDGEDVARADLQRDVRQGSTATAEFNGEEMAEADANGLHYYWTVAKKLAHAIQSQIDALPGLADITN